MARDYVIIVDDFCDLPDSYLQEHKLEPLKCSYSIDDENYQTPEHPEGIDPKEFYNKMREGASTKSGAVDPSQIHSRMEQLVKEGKDVLYIAFSSALSSTYRNGAFAAEEIMEEYPEAKVYALDSLSASLGLGLLIHYALIMKQEGATMDEIITTLEKDKLKFCHYFTVDDLHFLHRGGRVSKATAVVGSLLGIKPVLHVDEQGNLIGIGKVRGRKQSLQEMVKKMGAKIGNNRNDVVFISHGDCEEDAKYVAELVKKQFKIKSFLINYVGLGIGSHSGPGTVALFFVGDSRTESGS